jgi:hypothetical protein
VVRFLIEQLQVDIMASRRSPSRAKTLRFSEKASYGEQSRTEPEEPEVRVGRQSERGIERRRRAVERRERERDRNLIQRNFRRPSRQDSNYSEPLSVDSFPGREYVYVEPPTRRHRPGLQRRYDNPPDPTFHPDSGYPEEQPNIRIYNRVVEPIPRINRSDYAYRDNEPVASTRRPDYASRSRRPSPPPLDHDYERRFTLPERDIDWYSYSVPPPPPPPRSYRDGRATSEFSELRSRPDSVHRRAAGDDDIGRPAFVAEPETIVYSENGSPTEEYPSTDTGIGKYLVQDVRSRNPPSSHRGNHSKHSRYAVSSDSDQDSSDDVFTFDFPSRPKIPMDDEHSLGSATGLWGKENDVLNSQASLTSALIVKFLPVLQSQYTGDGSIGGLQLARLTVVHDLDQASRKSTPAIFRWMYATLSVSWCKPFID